MVNIGPLELVVVLVIALLVLGPQRLPEVARSMGKGMREFRSAISGEASDDDEHTAIGDDEQEPDELTPDEQALERPS
jgi:sec-independent protein translocase protein TatA